MNSHLKRVNATRDALLRIPCVPIVAVDAALKYYTTGYYADERRSIRILAALTTSVIPLVDHIARSMDNAAFLELCTIHKESTGLALKTAFRSPDSEHFKDYPVSWDRHAASAIEVPERASEGLFCALNALLFPTTQPSSYREAFHWSATLVLRHLRTLERPELAAGLAEELLRLDGIDRPGGKSYECLSAATRLAELRRQIDPNMLSMFIAESILCFTLCFRYNDAERLYLSYCGQANTGTSLGVGVSLESLAAASNGVDRTAFMHLSTAYLRTLLETGGGATNRIHDGLPSNRYPALTYIAMVRATLDQCPIAFEGDFVELLEMLPLHARSLRWATRGTPTEALAIGPYDSCRIVERTFGIDVGRYCDCSMTSESLGCALRNASYNGLLPLRLAIEIAAEYAFGALESKCDWQKVVEFLSGVAGLPNASDGPEAISQRCEELLKECGREVVFNWATAWIIARVQQGTVGATRDALLVAWPLFASAGTPITPYVASFCTSANFFRLLIQAIWHGLPLSKAIHSTHSLVNWCVSISSAEKLTPYDRMLLSCQTDDLREIILGAVNQRIAAAKSDVEARELSELAIVWANVLRQRGSLEEMLIGQLFDYRQDANRGSNIDNGYSTI